MSNSWHSPVATIVLFLLAFLQYAFVEILLRRFGTWRPISGNKPLEQQEYLLPTIVWSMPHGAGAVPAGVCRDGPDAIKEGFLWN
ncbi:MAG: hypothetical protein V8T47_07350 [Oscillospiraceae bacterium]